MNTLVDTGSQLMLQKFPPRGDRFTPKEIAIILWSAAIKWGNIYQLGTLRRLKPNSKILIKIRFFDVQT